jgi:hypothetical protein
MVKFLRALVVVVVGLAVLTSCAAVNPVPESSEIEGSWTSEDGANLTLAADGTFSATSIPVDAFALEGGELPPALSSSSAGSSTDGSGSWTITDRRAGPFPVVELTFATFAEPLTLDLRTTSAGNSRTLFISLGRTGQSLVSFARD